MFHYHESTDTPIRIIPTDQPAVDSTSEAGIAACEAYRSTLDESKLLLTGEPTVLLFREPTFAVYEKARLEGGMIDGTGFNQPTARALVRRCLIGWENPHPSWPPIAKIQRMEGGELVVSKSFADQLPPMVVSECGLTLWRHLLMGAPNEPKGKGEIQAAPTPGN